MSWTVLWKPRAVKEREKLDVSVRQRIVEAIERYADSGLGDVKPLTGSFRGEFRLKVGKWRVRFRLEEETGIMRILHVLPRDKAYEVREPESEFSEDSDDDEVLTGEELAHLARGRADHAAGRVIPHEEVKREFGW